MKRVHFMFVVINLTDFLGKFGSRHGAGSHLNLHQTNLVTLVPELNSNIGVRTIPSVVT